MQNLREGTHRQSDVHRVRTEVVEQFKEDEGSDSVGRWEEDLEDYGKLFGWFDVGGIGDGGDLVWVVEEWYCRWFVAGLTAGVEDMAIVVGVEEVEDMEVVIRITAAAEAEGEETR